jgi:hypothetical protein
MNADDTDQDLFPIPVIGVYPWLKITLRSGRLNAQRLT